MASDSGALARTTPARRLLFLIVPALVVGTAAALALLARSKRCGIRS
ncbi:hypothetical protein ACNPQM_10430 [Streptomyces sp. NPDC056231]